MNQLVGRPMRIGCVANEYIRYPLLTTNTFNVFQWGVRQPDPPSGVVNINFKRNRRPQRHESVILIGILLEPLDNCLQVVLAPYLIAMCPQRGCGGATCHDQKKNRSIDKVNAPPGVSWGCV